jgi:uncharacterized SAM-dependent methyltransferase
MSQGGRLSLSDGDAVAMGVDPTMPNVARMYDYYLGGKDNYAVDRELADRILLKFPELRAVARENRIFMANAAEFLAVECGIRQFLDLGSGLPTQRNIHQVVQGVVSGSKVVYTDYDRIVIVHARALLTDGEPGATAVVEADVRDPEAILNHPDTRALLDFSQPVAILLGSIMHFVPDADDPFGVVSRLREAMVPGSYLVVTHAAGEDLPDRAQEAFDEYLHANAQVKLRSRDQISSFFDGLELVDPGWAPYGVWRNLTEPMPGDQPCTAGYVGIGRKP